MATTTIHAIRDQITTKIEAISTASPAGEFRRADLTVPIEQWTHGSTALRAFEVRLIDAEEELGIVDASARRVRRQLEVMVGYPKQYGLYGIKDRDDLFKVLDDDGRLVFGVIADSANYLSGQELGWPTQREPIELDDIVLLPLSVECIYFRAL